MDVEDSYNFVKQMTMNDNSAIFSFTTIAAITFELVIYVVVIVSLAQCKTNDTTIKNRAKIRTNTHKRIITKKDGKVLHDHPTKLKLNQKASESYHAKGSINGSRKNRKKKKSGESDDDEEKQVAEDLKPKKIARNAKEERIARGKEMRGKGDYPTMDDVLSDWDSARDGKKEEAKVNEDIETRTNLDDVDEERLSKSAMDQTKRPESKMQEADDKNRELNENQASKESIKGKVLSEKNTQADDEERGTEKEDGSSREGKIKSQKRLLEKRERKAVEKQKDLTSDPEVSITQQSVIINGSCRSVKTQQETTSVKTQQETTAEPESSPADETVLQESKLRSEGRPYADSGNIAECMTQRTTGSTREEVDAKRVQIPRVKTELRCTIRKQTANHATTTAHEDGPVTAVEKAQEGSANEGSRSRNDISDGSAKDNKEEENREDDETPKMIAAESGTSEKVFSGRSSERSKKHLQRASASDGSRRTCDIVDRRNQEIKLSKDDSTQVADGDGVA